MKILHIIPSIDLVYGGPSRTSVCLANNQSLVKGCSIYFYTVGRDEEQTLDFSSNVKVYFRKRQGSIIDLLLLRDFRALRDIILREEVELVHLHGLWSLQTQIGAWMSVKYSIPYIVQPRGMLEPWSLRFRVWKKRIAMLIYQRANLKRAAGFVATSLSEKNSIRRLGLSSPVAVISNGVESPIPFSLKRRSGEVKTALFLSRLHEKKGVFDLLEAWAIVNPKGWRLRIVGPDEQESANRLKKFANKNQLDSVEIIGAKYGEERLDEFISANLFILPTYSENFGIAIAEALSYELPVITTTGAPWSSLIDFKCGWWIEPGVNSLVAAIASATKLQSEDLLVMGRQAKKLSLQYDWQCVAHETVQFYRAILDNDHN